ncbi:MAG: zf-HC2 domain-containing protein [Myxococcota bacterium]
MNCDQASEHLVEYHHDTLDPQTRDAMATHLASCGACARSYCRLQAELRGIGSAYAERPSAKARASLRKAVEAEFSTAPAPALWRALRRPVPVYGAVLAAIIPLALWMWSPSGSAAAEEPAPPAPARLHGYDATAPLVDPSVS